MTFKGELGRRYKIYKLPEKITISETNNTVELQLTSEYIRDHNMQEGGNAFEGWAIVARNLFPEKTIVLKVDNPSIFSPEHYLVGGRIKETDSNDEKDKHGHLCRFLYRAMKFSEQYDEWFKLSKDLKPEVKKFADYLSDKNIEFVSNAPTQKADKEKDENEPDKRSINENAIEAKLANGGIEKTDLYKIIGKGKVYRQLPVGLFEGEKEKRYSVFTYGHSAIDLWKIKDKTINIIELKTNNPMIGIVTEIFFYSNYIYDFIKEHNGFKLKEITDKETNKDDYRGYDILLSSKNNIEKVNGIMLAEDNNYYRCLLDSNILIILNNSNNKDIQYFMETYHYDFEITQCKK